MKKIYCFIVSLFYCSIVIYLLLPSPEISPLPNSFKSTEPGDTGQIPGVVAAYYTNLSREEIVDFYQKSLARSSFLSLPLVTLRLNHPPEYAREIVIETLHSDFFEEVVHPLRESVFINGWTPKEDKEYQRKAKPLYEFDREGKSYQTKVTLYLVPSQPSMRLVIFHLALLAIFGLVRFSKGIILSKWRVK